MMNKPFLLFDRIQHILLLKSTFLSDFGLLNGKMGVAIAFAHLYRKTLNDVYEDCMEELLDDIIERTYKGLDIDFLSGFSGIGWGIEYLLQNGFVEGNGVDICEDLDCKIMERDPRRITDLSLETGMEGLLHYVLAHLHGAVRQGGALPFDETYLEDLHSSVQSICRYDVCSSLGLLIDTYLSWYSNRLVLNYPLDIVCFFHGIQVDEKHCTEYSLGLRDGLSGIILKQILQ